MSLIPSFRKWYVVLGLSASVTCLGLTHANQPPDTKNQTKSQTKPESPKTKAGDDIVAKIREEGLNHSQVMKTVLYMTDVIGPRLTNSPGLKRANEWTAKTLTEFGLENAKLEPWGPFGTGWTLKRFSAQVTEPLCIPLIGIPKAWSPSTEGVAKGDLIHLDATDEKGLEKYKGKLKGAIVLVGSPREVKALFEAPGKRHTDKELLAMANAPEPVQGGGGRGGPQGKAFMKKAEETKKVEPAKAKDSAESKTSDTVSRIRAGMSFPSRRIQFLLDESAAVMVETSSRGDGGTFFVQSASVPQPPPAAGSETPAGGRGIGPRANPHDKNAPKTIPQVVVTVEHFNRLSHMLKAGEKLKAEIEIAAEFQKDDLMGYNTVAEIPGTDLKDEIVMLGGHMDSWHGGTGATDNAAGCAVGMEAVRILKKLGLKPRRTIRIALWTGEEQGLLGSRGYVSQQFGSIQGVASGLDGMFASSMNPSAPIIKKPAYDKFQAYFNLDNGSGKIRGVHLQGNEAARPIFRKWLQPFADMDATTITANNTGGTDHLSYDAIGLPGFQFIQDEIEYDERTHHSNMDVYDRLQADDLKQASIIMAATIWNAANMDERFPRKTLRRPLLTEQEAKSKDSEKKTAAPETKKSATTAG